MNKFQCIVIFITHPSRKIFEAIAETICNEIIFAKSNILPDASINECAVKTANRIQYFGIDIGGDGCNDFSIHRKTNIVNHYTFSHFPIIIIFLFRAL